MSGDLELPTELVSRPLALIGLAGLNTANTAHLLIWNSFASTNRVDRPPLNFLLVDREHTFRVAKAERTSYEWYIPKGILKRRWMHKHLFEVPGVLVLFFDLEWDDPSWKTKHLECANQLQALRTASIGRETKLVLVLLQSSAPLPSGEDALGADRAAALCQACDLSPKSLFVLPCRNDHLQGYILRLESAFYELSHSSYHQSSRAVRAHRDQLNKTNHMYLFVRHQFKMGFYNELKQDVAMAHKHYSQAYGHVLELRITDANVNEVKIVAGYIGYKVWKLSFVLNLPREAIAHFKSHMDFFRLRVGNPLGRFEHNAWLSAQTSVFGGLFEEAIELGLPAIQTQHPGFYYQQAAQFAVQRKKACYQDYAALERSTVAVDAAPDYSALDFYGQRPWRPNRLNLEGNDVRVETDNLVAALVRERHHTDHTTLIVAALTNAVNQFKNYRSPRMKQFLLVQMAEEYYRSGKYAEALTLLEPLVWDYRKDVWCLPLTSLLQMGLRCAYLSARPAEYVGHVVELCSPIAVVAAADRTRLFANLVAILEKRVPSAESNVDAEAAARAQAQWRLELDKCAAGGRCVATVVTNAVSTFVDVRAAFGQRQFYAQQPVEVYVDVRYTGPVAVQFSGLKATLSNAAYAPLCQVGAERLVFEPGQSRRFEFRFASDAQDIGGELQVTSVTLQMGTELAVLLRCERPTSGVGGGGVGVVDELAASLARVEFGQWAGAGGDAAGLLVGGPAEILPRRADVDVQLVHEPPALRGESYPFRVRLVNNEQVAITSVELSVTCSDGLVCEQPKMDAARCGPTLRLAGPGQALDAAGHTDWILYVQLERLGQHTVTFQIEYDVTSEVCGSVCTYRSRHVQPLDVDTVEPLAIEAQFQTMLFQPLAEIRRGEPFVAVVGLTNVSPFALVIEKGAYKYGAGVGGYPLAASPIGDRLTLQPHDKANDVAVLSVGQDAASNVRPGSYALKWKRASYRSELAQAKMPYSACSYELPEAAAGPAPLRVAVQLPAHGYVREPLNAVVVLRNASQRPIELDVVMDSNDAFMFAGNKQVKIQMYPGDQRKLIYNLYPLLSGYVALPPLRLTCGRAGDEPQLGQEALADLLSRHLPTHIYVLPQAKTQRLASTAQA